MAFQLEGVRKDLQDWASDFREGSRKWDFKLDAMRVIL